MAPKNIQLNKSFFKHNYAVIVAGGSGTRLWPLSRRNLPKQMQKFVSDKTLIDDTVNRLIDVIPAENIYVSTSVNYAEQIKKILPMIPAENIIVEPEARGTAAAFALFASTIYRLDPEARIFSLASDHAVTDIEKFQETMLNSFQYVTDNPTHIALVGIKPTRPDTGLGYIKIDSEKILQEKPLVYAVEKFVEKPGSEVAKKYVESDEYYWNAAYYCFSAKTLIKAYKESDPTIIKSINSYLDNGKDEDFINIPDKVHEIEIIDANKYQLVLVPADFSWSDIGNWQTLHELLASIEGQSLVAHGARHIDINSSNCLIFSHEDKLVATVGLDNLVVVDTPDVLLVLNKEQPQEIKQLLENLKENGLNQYL